MQDLMALLSQLMGQSSDPAASGGGGSGSGGGSPAPSGSGGGGAPAAQGSGGGAPAAPSSGGGAPATQGGGGGGAGAAGGATQGAGNASNGSKPAPSAGSGGIEGGPSATDGKPKVNKFENDRAGRRPGPDDRQGWQIRLQPRGGRLLPAQGGARRDEGRCAEEYEGQRLLQGQLPQREGRLPVHGADGQPRIGVAARR